MQEMVRTPGWVRLGEDTLQAFVSTVPLVQKATRHGPATKEPLNKINRPLKGESSCLSQHLTLAPLHLTLVRKAWSFYSAGSLLSSFYIIISPSPKTYSMVHIMTNKYDHNNI